MCFSAVNCQLKTNTNSDYTFRFEHMSGMTHWENPFIPFYSCDKYFTFQQQECEMKLNKLSVRSKRNNSKKKDKKSNHSAGQTA